MTPSVLLLGLGLWPMAWAQDDGAVVDDLEPLDEADPVDGDDDGLPDAPEEPPPEDDTLSKYRARFDVLADRAIGTTSVPVEFNWRRSPAMFAAHGSFLAELNNFDSVRAGGMARLPAQNLIVELGASYVGVWETRSTRLLALTPYRQPGRPNRIELDTTLAFPIAEGVVTAFPKFIPASQLVLHADATLRYSVYPTGFAQMRPGQVFGALLNPALTETELANLDDRRKPAMQIDRMRYGVMAGIGADIYFSPGLFFSPRMMINVPVFAPATGSDLGAFADLSLAVGWAL